jgi:hypothetical protein
VSGENDMPSYMYSLELKGFFDGEYSKDYAPNEIWYVSPRKYEAVEQLIKEIDSWVEIESWQIIRYKCSCTVEEYKPFEIDIHDELRSNDWAVTELKEKGIEDPMNVLKQKAKK